MISGLTVSHRVITSALLPLMLFALATTMRRLFSFADGMLFSADEPLSVPEVFEDSPADVFADVLCFELINEFGLLCASGSKHEGETGSVTEVQNTESSPGMPDIGSKLLDTFRL